METDKCNSCKKELANEKGATRFNCPSCAKYEIKRCRHCREIGTKYTCPQCGFSGPN
ncbi:MAG TPA: RNA-binding protein [Nanoarchaeota archaeon]|nr:RNA-binding protein [Nanoarchaeota archaeon]